VKHLLFASLLVFGDEVLALLEHQVHGARRALLSKEEPLCKRCREPRAFGVAHLAHIEHHARSLVDDHVGNESAARRLERDVAVKTSEHRDVERLLPESETRPRTRAVEDHDLHVRMEHLLDETFATESLSAPRPTEPRDLLCDGI